MSDSEVLVSDPTDPVEPSYATLKFKDLQDMMDGHSVEVTILHVHPLDHKGTNAKFALAMVKCGDEICLGPISVHLNDPLPAEGQHWSFGPPVKTPESDSHGFPILDRIS